MVKYSTPNSNRSEISTGRKIFNGVIKYLSLSRNAIVVVLSTVVIVLVMGSGEPPVNITGRLLH
jgi:hypothetical protein